MTLIHVLIPLVFLSLLIWRKPMSRAWRIILFGLSTFSAGQSRSARLFSPSVVLVNDVYQDGDSEYALRIYQPKGVQKPIPAAILCHGTTPKGEKHEALNLFAANLARIGIRSYIPELPILKQALVREETLQRIKRLYSLIASREEVRKDCILLAGFSFAGGFVLKASTESYINPATIFCYGSYYDLESSLRYFLTGRAQFGGVTLNISPHEYSRAVFFWNYLDQMELDMDMKKLRKCMHLFITNEQDKARALVGSLGEHERAFSNMAFDTADKNGIDIVEQALPKIRNQIQSISPKYFLDSISAPIFLAHGVQDTMIPYTETLALAEAFEKAGKEHYVFISRIFSHIAPEEQSALGFLKEMKALISFLNQLLKYLL